MPRQTKNPIARRLESVRRSGWRVASWYAMARIAGMVRAGGGSRPVRKPGPAAPGISVLIPSRNGRHLLEAQLPGIVRELEGFPGEIVIVDNGSTDGTAEWISETWPRIRVEVSPEPLSFACAVNRGLQGAAYSHVCLLNNDMLVDPGFFGALVRAFEQVPELFCATAQIRFPPGARREETGKAVYTQPAPDDFPIRCDEPVAGEDLSYVLYGSGGCSLYDARKLAALGGVDEVYSPAYVEDLDLGYRAWQCGWPTVYVAGAQVEHRHRATTSRYFTGEELDAILEKNYLRFVWRAVSDRKLFERLWVQALRWMALRGRTAPLGEVFEARHVPAACAWPEESILALTGGAVAVFPGRTSSGKPRAIVAAPSLPSSPGDLMRQAARFDMVLVAFTESLVTPAPELLETCLEIVEVRQANETDAPAAFRAALQQTVRKWRPAVAHLESTRMARYSGDCAPARAIVADHGEELLRSGGSAPLV
jgi:GT2 family glycosyltransferase